MSEPSVSIIIPAFNSGEYVLDAIESARQQTYSSVEIIVVDDGSTDDTREKLKGLIEEGKIRYHFQANRGLAGARNTGIKLARGKYVQFLDADDLITPDKIETQVECLEGSATTAICGCDYRFFDGANVSSLYGGDSFKGQFPLNSVARLFEFETVVHRWLFPKSIFEVADFDEDMPATEDWLLIWRLAAGGTKFLYVDDPLALYRKHDKNMTGDFRRSAAGHLLAIDKVERYQKQQHYSLYSKHELNSLRESYCYELGLYFLRTNQLLKSWYYLLRALLLSSNRRQVKLLLVTTIPTLGTKALDFVTSADNRLWRWRAQLRKTLVG